YALGLAWRSGSAQRLFFNWSTSFETPTLNELSNNPDGSGFNALLAPQRATHLELGWKGYVYRQSQFQLSAFWIRSTDELLPYQLASAPGRTFFRNVGQTRRLGLEGLLRHDFTPKLHLTLNAAWYYFSFRDTSANGDLNFDRKLPGIPQAQAALIVDARLWSALDLHLEQQFIGRIYADEANTVAQSPKWVSHVSLQYERQLGKVQLKPYFGLQNALGTHYADNLRINAFGGRYYEAAPRGWWFGGVRFAW
ncbi:MAG: TonB-dependent receptor, partial [Bacteroidetes bacterium]